MKSLWKTILDGLTYKDLAGHRQPRAYTVMTGLILLLLLLAGGMAGLNRHLLMSRVQATAESVQVLETREIESPVPTLQEVEISHGCPTDAADWSLTPTYISTTYSSIQPACVYQGLERTIAWALAVREGYSREEATGQLGFTDMPMRQMDQVMLPGAASETTTVSVSFIPPHPDFSEWRLNVHGEPSVAYALRGCFRTSNIVGNQVEIWGGEYPVICLVIEDAENTHIVYSLQDHVYTAGAVPTRSFLLFGYLKDGLWVWLGTQNAPKLEITDPQANAQERLTIATLYDSQPWDAKWLMTTYHLEMQSPPQNWQAMTDEMEKQVILNALASGLGKVTP